MFTGLMDHWVPSHDAISRFWKTPFHELKPAMDALCDEMAVNNFTFYTKWYTNGLKSSLPFLPNHPQAQNVLTDNAWGREWIDYFHRRGMTVGAMLQCYAFEAGTIPSEAVLGTWEGVHNAIGLTKDNVIIDPRWEGYPAMLEQMLDELLCQFPELDQVFLEFEGLGAPPTGHDLWRLAHPTPDAVPLISPAVRAQWEALGSPLPEDPWIWSVPVQEALCGTLRRHLAVAEAAMERRGFTGTRGVVYHAFGYEVPYILDCLPHRDWWLLPWNYWGWDWCEGDAPETVRRQLDFCKGHFRQVVKDNYRLLYIGNASLPTCLPDTVVEMARFCEEIGAEGHLGMGNFLPTYGLRWHGASEESVAAMRKLYRTELYPRR